MTVIDTIKRPCPCCQKIHEIKVIEVWEEAVFNHVPLTYTATYLFCEQTRVTFVGEDLLQQNDTALKDAYRSKVGLLTSKEIRAIREGYGFSQRSVDDLLGFDPGTVAGFETDRIQGVFHDELLRELEKTPEHFLPF